GGGRGAGGSARHLRRGDGVVRGAPGRGVEVVRQADAVGLLGPVGVQGQVGVVPVRVDGVLGVVGGLYPLQLGVPGVVGGVGRDRADVVEPQLVLERAVQGCGQLDDGTIVAGEQVLQVLGVAPVQLEHRDGEEVLLGGQS